MRGAPYKRDLPFLEGILEEKGIPKKFYVAIIGGGKACYQLLHLLNQERLSRLNMEIIGVSDIDDSAPGFKYAKELNIFTTTDFTELFTLKELNLIIELTGSSSIREQVAKSAPKGISLIDHRVARLLWDLTQIEMEKTQLEKEKQEYEERQRKYIQRILDLLPYRIMVVNMDMTVDMVNRTFLKEFNLKNEQVLGRRCYEVRYGRDEICKQDEGIECYLRRYSEGKIDGGFFNTIREIKGSDGRSRFDHITISPIFDEDGKLIQILEVSRDITETVVLERELQRSKTFFEKVIQSTVDGIVVVDTKGNVLIFNEGMERLTGYKAEEVTHLTSFYPIETAKENMRKMRSNEYGPVGMLNPTSMTITTKYGEEIPVTLSASIIKIDGKEVGSVGVFRDMREILKMRKELEDVHLSLVQSEKIASVGRMAAGVAHEINNPLSGIMLYAEILKENLKDNPQHLRDIQEIIDQTMRCKRIVSDLLEFSRQSIGKVSSFPLEELVEKSLNLLINQASFHDIQIIRKISPGLPDMVGDMAQLQQVFINLLINAADALEGKGRIVIEGDFDEKRGNFIIKVSDNGPGIPEELREKIFDIFFTTKPAGKGTGLGLSICQNIIKLHGGTISVSCPPEGGTTFTIELPLGIIEEPKEEPLFIGMDE